LIERLTRLEVWMDGNQSSFSLTDWGDMGCGGAEDFLSEYDLWEETTYGVNPMCWAEVVVVVWDLSMGTVSMIPSPVCGLSDCVGDSQVRKPQSLRRWIVLKFRSSKRS
jgi:hypothetical protein